MESKRIKCPRCLGLLEVTNPKKEPVLLITCPNPNCKTKIRVQFDTGETVIDSDTTGKSSPGYLTYKEQTFQLEEGRNTIGRSSSKHEAKIGFVTEDKSMSRLHCQIEAVRLKSGKVKAIISDVRSIGKIAKKPLRVEDEPLYPEDRIVLANGDFIQMGNQKIRYYQKQESK